MATSTVVLTERFRPIKSGKFDGLLAKQLNRHECPNCDRPFGGKGQLDSHLRSCTGEEVTQ